MEINLGKVGITPKGEFSSTIIYEKLDTVTRDGSSYLSLMDNNTFDTSNTFAWELIASKGDIGPVGPSGENLTLEYDDIFDI